MVVEELFTKLGFKVDESGLDKGKKAMASFKASALKFLGGLAIGAGLVSLAKTGVEAAMQMENLSAQFKVMTGSAEKAKVVLDDIAKFAAATPFDKLSLADAGKTLMAFGIQADSIVPTLRMLGDVAGPSAEKLKSLALVYGQIKSAGKLQGQDLMQLINQGFNPLNIIAEKTGMSMTDLKDAMAKGAISADMVTTAFEAATSKGGLFYNNLAEQSQTLAGKISTLKDNFVTALQNMAEAFFPLMKAAVDMAIAFDWRPIVKSVQSMATPLGAVVHVLTSLLSVVRTLGPVLLAVFGPVIWAKFTSSVSGSVSTMIAAFRDLPKTAANSARSIVASMKTVSGAIFAAVSAAWLLIDAMKSISQKGLEEMAEAFEAKDIEDFKTGQGVWELYGKSPEQVVEGAQAWVDLAKKNLQQAREQAKSGDYKAAKNVEVFGEALANSTKMLNDAKALYYKVRGVHYEELALDPSSLDPKTASKSINAQFEKMTKDLNDALKKTEKATKDSTKATRENTKALKEKPFNVADLARQSFDAQFNVKLKQMIIGAAT